MRTLCVSSQCMTWPPPPELGAGPPHWRCEGACLHASRSDLTSRVWGQRAQVHAAKHLPTTSPVAQRPRCSGHVQARNTFTTVFLEVEMSLAAVLCGGGLQLGHDPLYDPVGTVLQAALLGPQRRWIICKGLNRSRITIVRVSVQAPHSGTGDAVRSRVVEQPHLVDRRGEATAQGWKHVSNQAKNGHRGAASSAYNRLEWHHPNEHTVELQLTLPPHRRGKCHSHDWVSSILSDNPNFSAVPTGYVTPTKPAQPVHTTTAFP